MSTTGAVKQREKMISTYKAMLKEETNPNRIEAIKEAIKITEAEIEDVKKLGGKLFGKQEPLRQETTIIETDKDSQTIKVTRIPKDPKQQTEVEITQDGRLIAPQKQSEDSEQKSTTSDSQPSNKKLDNKLRSTLQKEAKKAAEESIQAKIAAAKAAKAKDNKSITSKKKS